MPTILQTTINGSKVYVDGDANDKYVTHRYLLDADSRWERVSTGYPDLSEFSKMVLVSKSVNENLAKGTSPLRKIIVTYSPVESVVNVTEKSETLVINDNVGKFYAVLLNTTANEYDATVDEYAKSNSFEAGFVVDMGYVYSSQTQNEDKAKYYLANTKSIIKVVRQLEFNYALVKNVHEAKVLRQMELGHFLLQSDAFNTNDKNQYHSITKYKDDNEVALIYITSEKLHVDYHMDIDSDGDLIEARKVTPNSESPEWFLKTE